MQDATEGRSMTYYAMVSLVCGYAAWVVLMVHLLGLGSSSGEQPPRL